MLLMIIGLIIVVSLGLLAYEINEKFKKDANVGYYMCVFGFIVGMIYPFFGNIFRLR